MGIQEALSKVLSTLPEGRLREVLDFAEFVRLKQQQEDWQRAGLAHVDTCYSPDESAYGDAGAAVPCIRQ